MSVETTTTAAETAALATEAAAFSSETATTVHPYLLSLMLGVVEGITEFLPVSSTAHLRLLQFRAGVDPDDPFWVLYSVIIQFGAVLCLPIYFRRRIMGFLTSFPRGTAGDRTMWTHPLTLVMWAFALTAVPGVLLVRVAGENLKSELVMGLALVIGGVVMWLVDIYCTRPKVTDVERVTAFQASCIGLAQLVSAIFPGTSRSMATIAAGQASGMSRPAALEFSFFLSLPTMAAACTYDLWKTALPRGGRGVADIEIGDITYEQWVTLGIGFWVSFFVAWAVVVGFMRWVQRRGFTPFAIWRIVLGGAVLAWWYRGEATGLAG